MHHIIWHAANEKFTYQLEIAFYTGCQFKSISTQFTLFSKNINQLVYKIQQWDIARSPKRKKGGPFIIHSR